MAKYSLRSATTDDIDFLTDVVVEATRAQERCPANFDEARFRQGFARWTGDQIANPEPGASTSVVERHGERIGRLRVSRDNPSIELAGMQLRPHCQGEGIGTSLVRELQREASATHRTLRLSVEKDNPRARQLYLRLGFELIGETDDEYLLRWTPAS